MAGGEEIRRFINVVETASGERLFEMPRLHTTPEDFGLGDPAINFSEYQRLADSEYTVLSETKTHLLAMTKDDGKFEVFMLNFTQRALVYYMEFQVHTVPQIGLCATQVAVWRRAGAGVPNVTSTVFKGFLLGKFAGVVSDRVQTADGRRFWVDRMAEAANEGQTVGLLMGTEVSSVFDGEGDIMAWLAETDAWGEGSDFENQRYFISKKKVTMTEGVAESFDVARFQADLAQAYSDHRAKHPSFYVGAFEPVRVARDACEGLVAGDLTDLPEPFKAAMRRHGLKSKSELLAALRTTPAGRTR